MKAAVTTTYGSAHVLELHDVPDPSVGEHEVLVQMHATVVTEGDRRLRAADFPSFTAVIGRLMFGLFQPRKKIQGTMFAGRVVAVGAAVTRYAVGDEVFGSADNGAYAEYLAVREDGALAKMPNGATYEEAAAVPYGAVTALHFLRELGGVQPGDRVLLVGASGGVGRFAVQIAKHLGAEVTAVCSRRNFELVRSLGADHVVDYTTEDFADSDQRYDVIFDIADATTFGRSKSALADAGRYLTLYVSLGVLFRMALTSIVGGRKAKAGVALGDRQAMEEVRDLIEAGVVRSVVSKCYPLEHIVDAHLHAETHRHGSVVVTMAAA